MTEIYELPQGRIIIGFSDENLSLGLLVLNPRQELPKHDRPVKEQLVQVSGTSVIKLFDKNVVKEVILNEGKKLEMPTNQLHIHSNPTNERSITLWKFEGNIVERIENIRNSYKRIL